MNGGSLNVDEVTAANMRRLREAKGWTQDAFAEQARAVLGLDWSRDNVATIERGQRRLSVGEVLALAHLFKVDLAELLTADGWVALTPGLRVKGLAEVCDRGHGRFAEAEDATDRLLAPTLERARANKRPDTEAEKKAARSLETSTAIVRMASRRLWKRSLDEERERRVTERAGQAVNPLTPRGTQALRGHVARELYDELREVLKRKR